MVVVVTQLKLLLRIELSLKIAGSREIESQKRSLEERKKNRRKTKLGVGRAGYITRISKALSASLALSKAKSQSTKNKEDKEGKEERIETYFWVVKVYLVNAVNAGHMTEEEAISLINNLMDTTEKQKKFAFTIIMSSVEEMNKRITRPSVNS